jgi:AraC family transcriptional regulator
MSKTDPVTRAVWYIESNLCRPLTLEGIAAHAHVSRFHMARLFAAVTGYSAMGYLRARRLTRAAELLLERHDLTVLAIALEVGYGSHEAFTRAFADRFGVTPSTYRSHPRDITCDIQGPIILGERVLPHPRPDRICLSRGFAVAGVGRRYDYDSTAGIPAQWSAFAPQFSEIPGQIDASSYGLCCNFAESGSFDYLCGVEVADPSRVPRRFTIERVPPARYAVFQHAGHVSFISRTVAAIWQRWLPASGYRLAPTPDFEKYLPDFDPATGYGGMEIWVPIG